MADSKISDLPAVTTLGSTDVFPVVTGGVTKKIAKSDLIASLGSPSGLYSARPSTPTVGQLYCVTDSTTSTLGAAISGGGGNTVLAWWTGAAWHVIGI